MTIEEIKEYFESKGGKSKVQPQDQVWTHLVRLHNAENPKNRLTFSCGSCRSKAYKWLLTK